MILGKIVSVYAGPGTWSPPTRARNVGVAGGSLFNEQLLIKEAKRRHRRRLAIVGGSVLLIAGLVGAGAALLSSSPSTPHRSPPPTDHAPPAPESSALPSTPAVPASDPTCTASQLAITYVKPGGAAGNWVSSFTIADTSAQPCALRSGVTVELFDASGNDRIASTQVPANVALSPNATLPPLYQAPSPKERLASISLMWPTIPNAVTQLTGGVGVQCPEPLFTPQSARITFAGLQPVTVHPVPSGNAGLIPPNESICGSNVQIMYVDADAS